MREFRMAAFGATKGSQAASARQTDRPTIATTAFLGLGVLLSAALMIGAARGDLWLDEVWSIFIAEAAKTPWEIVSLYKHDNNHVLNTLFIYLLGRQDNLMIYRALAIVSGIGSMVILVSLARKWGHPEGIFALLLAGSSYPLILYFSEARGYAPAMFFAVLSLSVLKSSLSRPGLLKALLFWAVVAGGVLSHLSFVAVLLSLFLYAVIHQTVRESSLKGRVLRVSQYFLVPVLFAGVFYLFYARNMVIGGGNINDKFSEIARGVSYLLGLPASLHAGGLALALFAVVVLSGAWLLYRDRDAEWSFYISVLVLSPALMLLVMRPEYFWFRYFVVCFPFFYLMASFVLGKMYRRRHAGFRYGVSILLCLYVAGQMHSLVPLVQLGRGNYRAVIAEASNRSSGDVITMGSDHDFRNRLLLSFYERFLPPGRTLHYVEQSSWGRELPEWIITHSLDPSYDPPPWIAILGNQMYELTKIEKFSGNSGFGWYLYHRATDRKGVPQG
jgi:hypothetical protein